ncbi:DOPA 4,5-dioxygenase family protein [Vibrio profundum]|uniref:DOPA 4,5-dioxygenase family protein n=1 Tax=Vibrio profundum TaxID=2910247 RepID=UPI003D12C182
MSLITNSHDYYHAHIYFDEQSSDAAWALRTKIAEELHLEVGRFHQKLVGPHPKWSFMVLFTRQTFDFFTDWLDKHHQELSVLIHASTGDDYIDHTQFACWLGQSIELDLADFKRPTS